MRIRAYMQPQGLSHARGIGSRPSSVIFGKKKKSSGECTRASEDHICMVQDREHGLFEVRASVTSETVAAPFHAERPVEIIFPRCFTAPAPSATAPHVWGSQNAQPSFAVSEFFFLLLFAFLQFDQQRLTGGVVRSKDKHKRNVGHVIHDQDRHCHTTDSLGATQRSLPHLQPDQHSESPCPSRSASRKRPRKG